MADKLCSRPGCDNPTKNKYCSRPCANKDKGRVKALKSREDIAVEIRDEIKVIRSGRIPAGLEDFLIQGMGYSRASPILSEIKMQIAESHESGTQLSAWPSWMRNYPYGGSVSYGAIPAVPRMSLKPPTEHQIEPHAVLQRRRSDGILSDFRRDGDIGFADIDRMLRLAPCLLASRLKKGPIMSALSGKRKWVLDSKNNKLKVVAEADLINVFQLHAQDMLLAMDYGAAFGSTIWERVTAEQIGVKGGVGDSTKWYAVHDIQWAHPETVPEIVRKERTYEFLGFQHRRSSIRDGMQQNVVIAPPQALVLTYGGKFGNMWGESLFEPVYDFAYWYEVVMRSLLRYLERMGTPVAVCYGPSHGRTVLPDGTPVDNPEYGLLLAGSAATHGAVFVPSDVDISSGQQIWRLDYLQADQRGEQFVTALQYIATMIMRGVVVGDRAATQDNEVGSYAAAREHGRTTQVDSDYIFKRFLGQLNRYFIPRYAEFNISATSPPLIRLEAQVLDPAEQETMMKLLATAGNFKIGEGSPLDRIDWEEALANVHAPILSDEEVEAQRKKRLEERKEQQKALMPKPQPGMSQSRPGLPSGRQQQPQTAQRQRDQNGRQGRLAMLNHLVDGGFSPVLLMREDVDALRRSGYEEVDLTGLGVELAVDRGDDSVKDPEFERKHPRGERGRFAKVEEGKVVVPGEESEEDIDSDDETGFSSEGGYEFLDQPLSQVTWTNPDNGEEVTLNTIKIDGIEYLIQQGVTNEELIAYHEVNKRVYERGTEIYGQELVKVDNILADGKNLNYMIASAAQNPLKEITDGAVYMDTGLVSRPDLLEPMLFHETMHCQPRLGFGADHTNAEYYRGEYYLEEIANGLLDQEYSERYGLPVEIGWQPHISTAVKAAQELGWDKNALYAFTKAMHKVDASLYRNGFDAFFEAAGVSKKYYPEALDQWYGDWRSVWDDFDAAYGRQGYLKKSIDKDGLWSSEWTYKWDSAQSERFEQIVKKYPPTEEEIKRYEAAN